MKSPGNFYRKKVALPVAIAALGVNTSLQQLAQLGWCPVLMLTTETAFLAALIFGGLLVLP